MCAGSASLAAGGPGPQSPCRVSGSSFVKWNNRPLAWRAGRTIEQSPGWVLLLHVLPEVDILRTGTVSHSLKLEQGVVSPFCKPGVQNQGVSRGASFSRSFSLPPGRETLSPGPNGSVRVLLQCPCPGASVWSSLEENLVLRSCCLSHPECASGQRTRWPGVHAASPCLRITLSDPETLAHSLTLPSFSLIMGDLCCLLIELMSVSLRSTFLL